MLGTLETAFNYFGSRNDLSAGNPESSETANGGRTANEALFCPYPGTNRNTSSNLKRKESVKADREKATEGSLGFLLYVLSLDEQLTTSIGYFSHPTTRFQEIVRNFCKVLEISGHGVIWFVLSFLLIGLFFVTRTPYLYHYGWNMLLVLIIDIVIVAPVKLVFKRPRPRLNIGVIPFSVSQVDQYAFPSGHASRSVALAALFCYMPPFNPWTHLWYIWGMLVSLSRIALGRHHLSDVVAGMFAGLVIFEVARRTDLLSLGT